MTALAWSLYGAAVFLFVLMLVGVFAIPTPETADSFPAVMIERERDFDVTGYPNTDLPAALPMTEMTDE